MKKFTFRTKFFYAECELEGDESPLEIVQEIKSMIDLCEELEFPEEAAKAMPKTEPVEKNEPATDRQKNLMNNLGIEYGPNISKQEAFALIQNKMKK